MTTKGIILAGGSGSRLHPCTLAISKQLLPVYDKPMIYYPLSVLMLAHIKEVLIISTPHDLPLFKKLLGDGSQFGMTIEYAEQAKPNGLAEAFIIGNDFCQNNPVCLILGDNIFYGDKLSDSIKKASTIDGACIFAYHVKDPERYGVVEFDNNKNAISLEEKPLQPKSHYAVPGLYFYDSTVYELAKNLKPSKRNELEITDLNKIYLENKKLKVEVLGRGIAWFDTGTHASLLEASNFIAAIQDRQGNQISCLEEIAYYNGWINDNDLISQINKFGKSSYAEYLKNLLEENK